MALNPSIILAGQAPDVMGAMSAGLQQAQNQLAFDRQNALHDLYRTQGPQIMAGDQAALNQLAQFDPTAALGVQDARLGMDSTRLSMDATRQRMTALDASEAREAERYAREIGAEAAAAEAAKIEEAVKAAMMAPDAATFDAMMAQMAPELVGQFDNRQMLASRFMSMAEILKMNAPGDPLTTEAKLAADFQAGRIDQATYEAGLARLAPKGTSLTVDPTTGAVTFQEGAGVGGGAGGPTVGQVYNPNEIQSVLGLIDQIAQDPNLSDVVGNKAIVLGGGNMVNEMNLAQRVGYGTGGLSAIEKIGQLQSNAWLSARAMLKGGGAITDYESKKAEAAVARLERPKSEADFRAALKELRDAITEGEAKLRGVAPANTPAPAASPTPAPIKPAVDMSDDEFLKSLGLE